MFTDPVTLIDQTINNLENVAELLVDEFDARIHSTLSEEGRTCRAAHAAIKTLLPKLRAARATQSPPGTDGQRPHCINCD